MKTVIHPGYVRGAEGWTRRPLRECPGCKPKCIVCSEPFTCSTADNALLFCSIRCEDLDSGNTDRLPQFTKKQLRRYEAKSSTTRPQQSH